MSNSETVPSATTCEPGTGAYALPREALEIASGYAFRGPAIDLGALLWDGRCLSDARVGVPLSVLSRHGLVAGAHGTGRTRTLQLMAEQLSAQGVPVFLADVKGDLSGISAPGPVDDKARQRAGTISQECEPTGYPAEFYALGGVGCGIPVRATVTSFGPVLLAKVLRLDPAREQDLCRIFHYADCKGLELDGLRDLRAVIAFLTSREGRSELETADGLSAGSAEAILRELTALEEEGTGRFFGGPEFDTWDLMRTAQDGRGTVSVLELAEVRDRPLLFSTFMMYLLADLCHDLPEASAAGRPKLVFFLDEAHLLFDDASEVFLESVTEVLRLIRSKGVGVFFVTGTARDVPGDVLDQLGNRVQHALLTDTLEDQKALVATARTFPDASYDLERLLTRLDKGEAVVRVVDERGGRTPVAVARLRAPESLMCSVGPEIMGRAVTASPLFGRYAQLTDREAAYERIATGRQEDAYAAESVETGEGLAGSEIYQSLARSPGKQVGREITRLLFGTARRRR
ncbi:ATPase [Streptomyces fumigatiscleroticus]|nr:ATPase [Streptomyces fumigatiscleroticus]